MTYSKTIIVLGPCHSALSVFPRGAAAGFVAEIDGSFPGKAPRDLSHLSQANFLFNLND